MTRKAIAVPSCFLSPDDTGGLLVCSLFRSFQVQCLVHRLHSLAEKAGLPPRSQPFISLSGLRTHPPVHTSTSTSVLLGRKIIGFCVPVNGNIQGGPNGHIDYRVENFEDDTIEGAVHGTSMSLFNASSILFSCGTNENSDVHS